MAMEPLRTLFHGYGAALALAALASPLIGVMGAILAAWVGGALLVLLLTALRRPLEADRAESDLAAASLARFSEDRLADRARREALRRAN